MFSSATTAMAMQTTPYPRSAPPPPPPKSMSPASMDEIMMEPAIEGPPSPESLRAISNQMRRASAMDKHQSHQSRQSHQTTSSGSSSLRSASSVSRRPSWDHALETATSSLSRKSSGRSAKSIRPRDRHESVQIFGRPLFGKRNKFQRESSAQSSSNSSLYSVDSPLEKSGIMSPPPMPAPPATSHGLPPSLNRESSLPSFFSRRRLTKSGSSGDVRQEGLRRLQISGPYNFQHLTHTQREQLPNLQRGGSPNAVQNDFVAAVRSSRAAPLDGMHFYGFSSEVLPLSRDDMSIASPNARPYTARQHSASVSAVSPPPSRTLLHSRSQDQLRIPPPRPPRSPIGAGFPASPPVPPPRLSSRVSIRYGSYDPLTSTTIQRPQTSGGFRQPTPLSFPPDAPAHHQLLHPDAADMNAAWLVPATPRTAPAAVHGNANWPLASPVSAGSTTPSTIANTSLVATASAVSTTPTLGTLPGVPEEDETVNSRNSMRKSRASMVSNSSSLRASQSLPMLRQFTQSQMPAGAAAGTVGAASSGGTRPPSSASDTLGRFDIGSAQRALRESIKDAAWANSLPKESWEDDIDYCYEHAAEADCEYAWDRPSMDLSRDDDEEAGGEVGGETGDETSDTDDAAGNDGDDSQSNSHSTSSSRTQKDRPVTLVSGGYEVPALSPAASASSAASVGSAASFSEAVTPTGLAKRRPSLTIQTKVMLDDEARPMHRFLHGPSHGHVRTPSRASSFKESHGFNLSPSLFIPGSEDYYSTTGQHQPARRGDRVGFAIGAEDDEEFPAYVEPALSMETSTLIVPTRTSASTTASQRSHDSVLSDRHISAASTATDLTRLTMSTNSIEDLIPKVEPETAVPLV